MDTKIIIDGEGLSDVEVLVIPEGSTGREVVRIMATKAGVESDEVLLFVEDSDEPLDLDLIIKEDQAAQTIHHVHRARRVNVSVHYQNEIKTEAFSPSTRIQVVLDWAVSSKGFNIDPVIAPEMELALHGESKELPKQAHIGRYVRHPHHQLSLDLIRGVVPNGAKNSDG